jgi:hypothetical protein
VTVIALKLFIVLTCALLGAWVLRQPALEQWSERAFRWRVTGLQLALGLGLFVVLYGVGKAEVTSDVPGYYLPAARAALAGKLPLRDFETSYAPLFPYVGAALVATWNSGKVFALFAILLNVVTLLAWHSAALTCFGRQSARRISVLYATSGHVLIQTLLGTNQVWIACLLGTSVLLLIRAREIGSGLAQGLAICTTKFLAALFWPVLWITAPSRWRWLFPALLLSGLCFALFAALGADLLTSLHAESDLISSGNLPYLLAPVAALSGAPQQLALRVFDGGTVAALSLTLAWIYWRTRALSASRRPLAVFAALALVQIVFLLVSKKSYTGYAAFALYPITAVAAGAFARPGLLVGFLLLLNALLAIEPTLWFHLHGNGLSLDEWIRRSSLARAGSFVMLDLTLLGCYALTGRQAVQELARVTTADVPIPGESQCPSAADVRRSASAVRG